MEMEGKWFENWSNLLSFENLFAGVAFFSFEKCSGRRTFGLSSSVERLAVKDFMALAQNHRLIDAIHYQKTA